MIPTTISVWLAPYSNPPTISYPMWCVPPAVIAGITIFIGSSHCDSFTDQAPVDLIFRCPPSNGFGSLAYSKDAVVVVLWDAPRHQKVACIISLRVHALPIRVAPMPAVKYDLNGGLPTSLRFIIYQEYMVIAYWSFLKLDLVSVSILIEQTFVWIVFSKCVLMANHTNLNP